jgi:hypothetical protein
MPDVKVANEAVFLEGLRQQIGRRVRIWYEVPAPDGGPQREIVEGRLKEVRAEVVLADSQSIHPSSADVHTVRTAPTRLILGYAELDQVNHEVTRTFLRPDLHSR